MPSSCRFARAAVHQHHRGFICSVVASFLEGLVTSLLNVPTAGIAGGNVMGPAHMTVRQTYSTELALPTTRNAVPGWSVSDVPPLSALKTRALHAVTQLLQPLNDNQAWKEGEPCSLDTTGQRPVLVCSCGWWTSIPPWAWPHYDRGTFCHPCIAKTVVIWMGVFFPFTRHPVALGHEGTAYVVQDYLAYAQCHSYKSAVVRIHSTAHLNRQFWWAPAGLVLLNMGGFNVNV